MVGGDDRVEDGRWERDSHGDEDGWRGRLQGT